MVERIGEINLIGIYWREVCVWVRLNEVFKFVFFEINEVNFYCYGVRIIINLVVWGLDENIVYSYFF